MSLKHLIDVCRTVKTLGKCNGVQCADKISGSKAAKLFGFDGHLRSHLALGGFKLQKKIGALDLHMGGYAARKPVLDSLNAALELVVTKDFRNLGWASKVAY